MHVTDLVNALELALTKGRPGTYDLPSSKPYTVQEIVETAARVCDIEPDLELVPTSEETLTFYSVQEPFATEVGFEQKLSLEAGMKRYLEYLRSEPPG
jgi:nucleoside-diphosphate-sugar epimerase